MARVHLTRRDALAAAGLLTAAACTSSLHKQPGPAKADPDGPLRDAGAERERALLALSADALASAPALAPRLAPLLADHQAHLAALGGANQAPRASSAAVARRPPAAVLAQLRLAEHTAAAAHAAAVLTASPGLAATLASLAACESSHGVVL